MLREKHRTLAMFDPVLTGLAVGAPILLGGELAGLVPDGDLTLAGGQAIEIMAGGVLAAVIVVILVSHALRTVLIMSGPVKTPWSRGDKIALAGVIAALMGVVAAIVVPLAT